MTPYKAELFCFNFDPAGHLRNTFNASYDLDRFAAFGFGEGPTKQEDMAAD